MSLKFNHETKIIDGIVVCLRSVPRGALAPEQHPLKLPALSVQLSQPKSNISMSKIYT